RVPMFERQFELRVESQESAALPHGAEARPSASPLPSPFPQPVARARLLLRQVFTALAIGALAVGSYLLITRFVLQSVEVVGVSMMPTLRNSERYLLNRWIFHVRDPRPGDIVVLRDPVDHGYAVKRVI